jgi:hypothetical protein
VQRWEDNETINSMIPNVRYINSITTNGTTIGAGSYISISITSISISASDFSDASIQEKQRFSGQSPAWMQNNSFLSAVCLSD